MESQGIIVVPWSNYGSDSTTPKDTRDKIVIELLETERKYVQDLETLQVRVLVRIHPLFLSFFVTIAIPAPLPFVTSLYNSLFPLNNFVKWSRH